MLGLNEIFIVLRGKTILYPFESQQILRTPCVPRRHARPGKLSLSGFSSSRLHFHKPIIRTPHLSIVIRNIHTHQFACIYIVINHKSDASVTIRVRRFFSSYSWIFSIRPAEAGERYGNIEQKIIWNIVKKTPSTAVRRDRIVNV